MEDSLLIRFIEKKTTKQEAKEVLSWIEQSDENKKYFTKLHSVWTAIELSKNHNKDTKKINKIIKLVQKERKKTYIYRYIAAVSIAIVFIGGFFVWRNKEFIPDYESEIKNISSKNEITLKINNKKEIQIKDSIPTVAYNKKHIVINDTIKVENNSTKNLNTIHVPFGKRTILTLADGSTVHLNSGSTLVFPSTFDHKKREVYLDGEAFFEVTTKKEQPFIVQTLYRAIEVYGTKFNVSIDRELEFFETVLVNGSIAVKNKQDYQTLVPNQCYSYNKKTNLEDIKTVNTDHYTLWTQGKLLFQKEELYKAIQKLEKIYNIQIVLSEKKYMKYHVSGLLNLNDRADITVHYLMSTISSENPADSSKLFHIIYNK